MKFDVKNKNKFKVHAIRSVATNESKNFERNSYQIFIEQTLTLTVSECHQFETSRFDLEIVQFYFKGVKPAWKNVQFDEKMVYACLKRNGFKPLKIYICQ